MRNFLGLFVLCIAMTGCRTQYVPMETVRTEYRDHIQETHTVDSVTDTRLVYINGDTVIDWRDRVKWRDREVHDTVYVEKADTIRVPYPVERTLTRWEKARMNLGALTAIIAVAASILILPIWILKKIRNK